ncbi:MAG: hypothetical protein ACR2QJ_12115 [Geminicoccaceae bacterium]
MTTPSKRETRWPLTAGLLLTVSALIGASLVQAEVVDTKPSSSLREGGPVIHQQPVALQCWQKGRRIIKRDGLSGLAVKAVTRKGAVAFKPLDSEQPEIFLLPFDDSLCLIGPED